MSEDCCSDKVYLFGWFILFRSTSAFLYGWPIVLSPKVSSLTLWFTFSVLSYFFSTMDKFVSYSTELVRTLSVGTYMVLWCLIITIF